MSVGQNTSAIQARFTKVVAGISKHVTSAVVLDNTTYATPAQLAQAFQDCLNGMTNVAATKAAYHAAVIDQQTLYKKAQVLWLLLEAFARATYGSDTATLADFGYSPEKHTPPSPATKAAAAAKARATRAARHTMGKKQKLAVTGEPPAPPPPPAPAKSALAS